MPLEKKLAQLLIKHKKTLTLAESCSGGFLAHTITNIAGSSRFFKAGFITYSNESKTRLLKVPKQYITRYGSVSNQVASKMAQGARQLMKTDFSLSITGIAGPGGGSKLKPVGFTYIAINTKSNKNICKQYLFKGNRLSIKRQTARQALKLLLTFLP